MAARHRPIPHGMLVALACSATLAANADFREPPRYDGAGYAVLARAMLEGHGYREIDNPDAPPHAHFPPVYPLVLASLWALTGPSAVAAHALSFACTLGATLLTWRWFRSWASPCVALLLALALAVNWRWAKDGTAIRSEPLFLLLGSATLLASGWVARRGGRLRAASLGTLLGVVVLTRHVGLALAEAILVDLWMRGRRREVAIAVMTFALVVARWVAWLAEVRDHTQIGLVPVRGLGATALGNGLFYARRLIDQIIGPIVEVATVFASRFTAKPSALWVISAFATTFAALAAVVMAWGWVRLARRRRARAAGLVPAFTLAMLLAWPFTEAGRFLVPLIPFVVAGLAEGFAAISSRWDARSARRRAALVVLAISLPYSLYAIATRRAAAERATQRDFDAACAWIAAQDEPRGPVLSRHPGEVFLRTGRTGLVPTSGDLVYQIVSADTAFLIDEHRFVFTFDPNAPIREGPEPPRLHLEVAGKWADVVVYRRIRLKPD